MFYTREQLISLYDYLDVCNIHENSFRHHFLGGYNFDSDTIQDALLKVYKKYANGFPAEYNIFLRIVKETLFDIETKDIGKYVNEKDSIQLRILYWRWMKGV
jgi:hypothetical protein